MSSLSSYMKLFADGTAEGKAIKGPINSFEQRGKKTEYSENGGFYGMLYNM